ncbi:MAG: UDP-N-acetylglucosamine 2-epimerase (non-hydrolyzing) [Bdellovibrio sp.]|nr:UDP-N-acetylglucosamine 2-epimerase (non-hydrolyzing) [Bdellovibrio sp.]
MIAIVAGTRPELIKVASIYQELKRVQYPVQLWLTGQHESLAEAPLEFFGLQASKHWKTLQSGQSSNMLLGKLLDLVDDAIVEEAPSAIVVQGDTTSALAGALAGFHRRIPIAHVEAGLRTGDLTQPFPEEMNRKVIDAFADWLFPPTEGAKQALLREGLTKIENPTGNTGIDGLFWAREKLRNLSYWPTHIPKPKAGSAVILSTGHRRENLGTPLSRVLKALGDQVRENENWVLYHVAHPNPEATRNAQEALQGVPRAYVLPPLSYPDFTCMLDVANVVVSDSGGIQEEAPSFGVKILITREVTERPEVLSCGGELVGTHPENVVRALKKALSDSGTKLTSQITPFGDGRASTRIVARMLEDLVGESGSITA